MYKGQRYRVTCGELRLPRDQWTKNGSYQAANQWWKKILADIYTNRPMTIRERQEEWAKENDPELAEQLAVCPADQPDEGDVEYNIKYVEALGVVIPEDLDPVVKNEIFGDGRIWQDRLARQKEVPAGRKLEGSVADFLALVRTKGPKPKTFKELRDFLLWLVNEHWTPGMDVSSIEESKITQTYTKIAGLDLSQPTKKKRWGFFRRFVNWLYTERRLEESPRNLATYSFDVSPKAVKEYPVGKVKEVLAGLQARERCWALLGLNCGMTNVDIGLLTHDMIKDGYLKRKRVKTEAVENVPVVSYLLWPETVDLLQQFRSKHEELWFVSSHGTKLVDYRMEEGEVRIKDLIGKVWQGLACEIPLSKFRNVAATLLESHEHYGRYVHHFLGHSPKTLKDKHYAAPAQAVFDDALKWLHDKVFA
jgi:hypothetical protein